MVTADGNVTINPPARLAGVPDIVGLEPLPDADRVELAFKPESDLSERVIFPVLASQSNGIEDARFLEFTDGDEKIFYATYTAYTGRAIRSELIETRNFETFRMTALQGTAARNKGMGLFPRKIDGKYAISQVTTAGIHTLSRRSVGASISIALMRMKGAQK